MPKSWLACLCVVAMGVLLVGTGIGCGGGGAGAGDLGAFVAQFLANEVRIDQSLPASFAPARLPVACCEGTTVYAVWEDLRNGQDDILFNVSTDLGATWLPNNVRLDVGTPLGATRDVRPTICCDAGRVYVAWVETRGFSNFNYYFNRSLDGGLTWLPTRIKLDTHPTGLANGSNPRISCCGNTVIVAWSDDRASGAEQIYIARSSDAGSTWSEQQIGGLAGFGARNPICCCEQSGMVQYVYVAWTDARLGSDRVFFDRSIDGGATWGGDVNLDASASFFASDISCDANYVYVAWMANNGSRTPRLRGSSNFGATFNAQLDLKTLAGGIASAPRICCQGASVHAVFGDDTGGQFDVYYNRSSDAGVTSLAGGQVRVDSGMAGNTSTVVDVCCNGANLSAVFFDNRSGTTDVWASRSTDAGATWSMDVRLDMAGGAVDAQNATVCCAGDLVYALYTDPRDGPNREQVQVNRSLDSGGTWLANDVRVSQANPPGGNGLTSAVRIVAKGSTVHAVLLDSRLGEARIFYNRSTNGGQTWLASDVLLDAGTPGFGDTEPSICCSGTHVYVAWERASSSGPFGDIYVIRSADSGLTWQPMATRVNTGVAVDSTTVSEPALCCSGLQVRVAWHDSRNGNLDIFFARSLDGGVTWPGGPLRVDHAPAATNATSPRICCEGTRVHVVWEDVRDGSTDIYTNRSLDGGATWQPMDTRLDVTDPAGANPSSYVVVCCQGSHVHVAWEDERDGDTDPYVASSSNGGATFGPDQRIDLGAPAGMGDSEEIAMCCEGARVFVAYADFRSGTNCDVYFNRSLDGGATWLPADLRLDIGDPPGADESDDVAICCHAGRVYVAWSDELAVNPGPYFTASSDSGATWLPSPIRISGAPQPFAGSQQIACTSDFVSVAWLGTLGAHQDAFINRTTP